MRKTILVVDDEEAVLRSLTATLAKLGLKVQVALSGPEGIDCFLRHREEILMVLADVVMPGMYGTQMADEIRRIDPEAKILLMSGYPEREIVVGKTGYGFIEKPILAIQLLNAIELLTGPVSGWSDRGLNQTFNT